MATGGPKRSERPARAARWEFWTLDDRSDARVAIAPPFAAGGGPADHSLADRTANSTVRHMFIVTYGRTGSTLLLGLLNAYDDVRVKGENFNALYYVYRAKAALLAAMRTKASGPSEAFFGAEDIADGDALEAIDSAAREIMRIGVSGERVVGLKEVRYDIPDLEEYIRYLVETFDGSLIVFLTRPSEEVTKSGFWTRVEPRLAASALAYLDREFTRIAMALPESCVEIRYQNLVEPGDALGRLLARLGLPWDDERIAGVLATKHSYEPRSTFFASGKSIAIRSREELGKAFADCWFDGQQISRGADQLSGALLCRNPGDRVQCVQIVRLGEDAAAPVSVGRADLASPKMEKKHPDWPAAGNCRFEIALPSEQGFYQIVAELPEARTVLGNLIVGEQRPTRDYFALPAGQD